MTASSCELYAGTEALEVVRRDGLHADSFDVFAGAAGGPKWLVLGELDRFLFGEWLPGRSTPLDLVGASIASWRFAAASTRNPSVAISRFQEAYLEQRYAKRVTASDVSRVGTGILASALGPSGVADIIQQTRLRLNVLTVRCRGWLASENRAAQFAGLTIAACGNAMHRNLLAGVMDRVLFTHPASGDTAFPELRGFGTTRVRLSEQNLIAALCASAAIPLVMAGVRDISGAPRGTYRDGGLLDYHMDLLLSKPGGVTLLPHFSRRVVTGWFDRRLQWRQPRHLRRTLLLVPSAEFLARLPGGRIPERGDFYEYADDSRIRRWRDAILESQRLADDFAELVRSGRAVESIRPLSELG
jgi:hypothetical protein